MDNLAQHKLLLQQMHDTYIKKNHDYGDSFSRSFKKYGLVAAMVRMEDKWNRLDNMASGAEQKVADETIRDTLLDLAGYCVMTTMELDRQKDNANQKAFEEQVRTEYADVSTMEDNSSDEKIVLHDEEKGDDFEKEGIRSQISSLLSKKLPKLVSKCVACSNLINHK